VRDDYAPLRSRDHLSPDGGNRGRKHTKPTWPTVGRVGAQGGKSILLETGEKRGRGGKGRSGARGGQGGARLLRGGFLLFFLQGGARSPKGKIDSENGLRPKGGRSPRWAGPVLNCVFRIRFSRARSIGTESVPDTGGGLEKLPLNRNFVWTTDLRPPPPGHKGWKKKKKKKN